VPSANVALGVGVVLGMLMIPALFLTIGMMRWGFSSWICCVSWKFSGPTSFFHFEVCPPEPPAPKEAQEAPVPAAAPVVVSSADESSPGSQRRRLPPVGSRASRARVLLAAAGVIFGFLICLMARVPPYAYLVYGAIFGGVAWWGCGRVFKAIGWSA